MRDTFLVAVTNADEALGHWVAVVRELFEEVGVLLCVNESGADVDLSTDAAKQRIEHKRREIVKETVGLRRIPRIGESLLRSVARGLLRSLGDAGDLFDAL